MRNFLCLFIFLLPISHAIGSELKDISGQVIRVGVFNNPPVSLQDDTGQWRGITIDILRAIAQKKGWKLEFIAGSFAKNQQMLENNQIDLISTIAYSKRRALKYSFTRTPTISNWGLIYTRPDTNIGSLLDLEGKHVAVMRNNIHDKAFRKLAKKFEVQFKHNERDHFTDVMESVQKGEVDAGVANRLFGALNANKYGLVETGIIFNPINIHYATLHSKHQEILNAIDQQLNILKSNKDSVYYSTLYHWLNPSGKNILPKWLQWVALALLCIVALMIGLTILLRRQVAARTLDLQKEVDEHRLAQEQLDCLAYYDLLTGLPNRVSFKENLKVAIASARRRNDKIAILFIDLDRFKTINDSLGHDMGDQLIKHVAKRLQDSLRDEDTITRFSGDEFVTILPAIHMLSDIHHIAKRMLTCLSTPINIAATEIYTSVSIGVALYPDDDDSGKNLLKYADAAMYHAKEQGGDNYQFYNKDFTDRIQNRLSLETRLRHAIERNELCLYYQPIFNLNDRHPTGVEALIRWQDPERGLIPPDDFIPLAEETGLIVTIGEWVLKEACNQVSEWEKQGLGQLRVAVNISSRQFAHNKLFSTVVTALQNSEIAPQQLELEITERMFLDINNNVREVLEKLKGIGVGLSIDDFGTGYSSLSYLKQLPIDTLKIDRSFVQGIPQDKDDLEIASTIISMAHGLGLDVVAEGIETEEQLNFLAGLECGRGQGYYISRPLPATEIAGWLQSRI